MNAAAQNVLIRWGKFNLDGALGMVLQLGALAILNRIAPSHYLWASTLALELTLLHNFVWHLHYTWRERRAESTVLAQLSRFHLSNGLVSMVGNLVLMRLLVQQARMPVLAVNLIAIVCCSIANFCLGEGWAFAAKPTSTDARAGQSCDEAEVSHRNRESREADSSLTTPKLKSVWGPVHSE